MGKEGLEAVGDELPAHPGVFRISHRLRLIFVWAVWTVGTLLLVLHVRHYGRNLPSWDDWGMVPIITGHVPVTLKWAWAQHNEHRMLVPKLILAFLFRWVALDFRTGLYFNAGLMSSAAALMIVLAHRLRGHQRLTDAVLPLSILTLAQSEALLLNYTLALVLPSWLTFGLIWVLGKASQRPPWMTVVSVGMILVILPLCGGGGLVMVPPLLFWLAGYLCCGWWSGREPGTWARAFGLSSLMACSAIIALHLSDYVWHTSNYYPATPGLWPNVRTGLELLSLSINSGFTEYWMAASLIALVLVVTALIRLSLVAVRLLHERPRAFGLAALFLSMMGLAVSVGLSRAVLGPGAGLASRYVPLAAPLLSMLYFTWLLYTPARLQRVLQTCLLLVFCLEVPYSFQRTRQWDEASLALRKRVEHGLKGGITESQFLDVACPGLHPHRKVAACLLKMLKSSEFGDFKYLRDDQRAAQIAVAPKPETMRR
jgi:hypothetical protein